MEGEKGFFEEVIDSVSDIVSGFGDSFTIDAEREAIINNAAAAKIELAKSAERRKAANQDKLMKGAAYVVGFVGVLILAVVASKLYKDLK